MRIPQSVLDVTVFGKSLGCHYRKFDEKLYELMCENVHGKENMKKVLLLLANGFEAYEASVFTDVMS